MSHSVSFHDKFQCVFLTFASKMINGNSKKLVKLINKAYHVLPHLCMWTTCVYQAEAPEGATIYLSFILLFIDVYVFLFSEVFYLYIATSSRDTMQRLLTFN